jgi:hypothetical protein
LPTRQRASAAPSQSGPQPETKPRNRRCIELISCARAQERRSRTRARRGCLLPGRKSVVFGRGGQLCPRIAERESAIPRLGATSASQAEGRQSDPGQAYPLTASNAQNIIGPLRNRGGCLVSCANIYINFQSMSKLAHFDNGAHGVVVSHPLSMREALGSIPSVSMACLAARNAYD